MNGERSRIHKVRATVNEVKFKRDTQLRNQLFTPESFSHPAKMDAQLLIWIVENFTKEGETILDPMFGSGTSMLACTLGRNVIGVELEQKFIDMAKKNWAKVSQYPQLGYLMGTCQILQGDARNLEGILADSIVTSPPYGELANEKKNTKSNVSREERLKRAGFNPDEFMGGRARNCAIEDGLRYSHDDNNIGNLPYGSIDSVITSPPYEGMLELSSRHTKGGIASRDSKLAQTGTYADTIITSPPYEQAQTGGGIAQEGYTKPYQKDKIGGGNIDPVGKRSYMPENHGITNGNIGNLKGDTYLSAMLQVYQQCHKVLKPNGLMILVVKNFIREKKIVRLDLDTIKLCEQSGFIFKERFYRKLPAQSFWRTIYYQKYPEVERLDNEDILVLTSRE